MSEEESGPHQLALGALTQTGDLHQTKSNPVGAEGGSLMQQEQGVQSSNKRTKLVKGSQPRVLAPMLQQYVDIKAQYAEHLLLFQVGDFYEIFFEDAVRASELLNIRLTSRDKDQENPIPMCGVPHHALDNYLPKLLALGCSCVIVSQVEDASKAKKGGVRREITRIVTPGVRFEGDGLDAHHYNYLAAICFGVGDLGAVAYVDISTGHLRMREVESRDELLEVLDRVAPAECIVPSILFDIPLTAEEKWLRATKAQLQQFDTRIVRRPFARTRRADVQQTLSKMLPALTPESIGAQIEGFSPYALTAMQCLLHYVEEVSFSNRAQLASLQVEESKGCLVIDSATRTNLELTSTRLRGEEKHSLLRHVDHTRTAMGARLLADWLLAPSTQLAVITERQDAVGELSGDDELLARIRGLLLGVRDLDRLCTRVTSGRAAPHDLGVLRDSLKELPQIQSVLMQSSASLFQTLASEFDALEDVYDTLSRALVDDPPVRNSEGGIFRDGYDNSLDHLRNLRSEGKSWLSEVEQAQRAETGIPSLKIKYNNVFGYFIEVSKAHLQKIPDHYERKQTLVNAERFVTAELKQREVELLSAHTRQVDSERELFIALREQISTMATRLQSVAHILATIDVLCSFAYCARQYNYTRPQIGLSEKLHIVAGRHPVVERVLGHHAFVPNDCVLTSDARRLAVLTGPNMGGKSTYLRQVGLIQLLAQAGSFVPAAEAYLPIVDRIFTRIGAADDLSRGESTFMVEMRETSVILRKATKQSLVLIDEVGRGTATTDGLAIATAVAEWLLDSIKCMTIFATHFHQLTALADTKQGAFCLSVGVVEERESISFTHRIEESKGDRSFGIEVAKLAGLPDALLRRASSILGQLCAGQDALTDLQGQIETERCAPQVAHSARGSLPDEVQEVLSRLKQVRTDSITPLQGLQELAELVQQASEID